MRVGVGVPVVCAYVVTCIQKVFVLQKASYNFFLQAWSGGTAPSTSDILYNTIFFVDKLCISYQLSFHIFCPVIF